jgi:hypothetical protein
MHSHNYATCTFYSRYFVGESAVRDHHIIRGGTQAIFQAGYPGVVVEISAHHFGAPVL